MNPVAKTTTRILTFILSTTAPALAADHIENLKHPDPTTRIKSLRALQTSLDPRIPRAVLPLLTDPGDSTRRLAARAIGSRWWQIPSHEVPTFTSALKANTRSGRDDERHMALRAIGLLDRNYSKNPMLAPSANGRWVIYERHGLPCLIDTRSSSSSSSEELLGYKKSPSSSGWFLPSLQNDEIHSETHWHPVKERVALAILIHRRATTLWVWNHPTGLHQLSHADVEAALTIHPSQKRHPSSGIHVNFDRWQGDHAVINVSYDTKTDADQYLEHRTTLLWSIPLNTLKPAPK